MSFAVNNSATIISTEAANQLIDDQDLELTQAIAGVRIFNDLSHSQIVILTSEACFYIASIGVPQTD